jgi:hypothetical protein
MQPKQTDQPAPDAKEKEKATGQDGQPAPPAAGRSGSRVVRPDSDKGSGGPPPEEIDAATAADRTVTADRISRGESRLAFEQARAPAARP